VPEEKEREEDWEKGKEQHGRVKFRCFSARERKCALNHLFETVGTLVGFSTFFIGRLGSDIVYCTTVCEL
jgi:hypothetical protein